MRFARGFTLFESLLALSLALPLLFVLVAVVRGEAGLLYRSAQSGAGRTTLGALVERWEAESHSAWALFTPANDVLGQLNCDASGACREVDFFMRDAAGSAHFWAWRYDATQQTLQRYTYADPLNPGPSLAVSGPAVAGIAFFEAHRVAASALANPMLHGYVPKDVVVNFCYPGVDGGNALLALEVESGGYHVLREFLPKIAPTGFNVIVGTVRPYPVPSATPLPVATGCS
jgi:hypothetical protein